MMIRCIWIVFNDGDDAVMLIVCFDDHLINRLVVDVVDSLCQFHNMLRYVISYLPLVVIFELSFPLLRQFHVCVLKVVKLSRQKLHSHHEIKVRGGLNYILI